MPYEMRWVPVPKDETLEVHQEIPQGLMDWGYHRAGFVNGQYFQFHECKKCGGWITGRPAEYRIDTLGPLCGRKGIEYYCRRCGYQIGFDGWMS
jgi:hypothetical protein